MREGGYTFGGEQSGHIIDLRRNTTGDGPATAIALLSILARSKQRLHDLAADVVVAPQILLNVRTPHKSVLDDPQIVAAGLAAQAELDGTGRLLIRASGTEPLLRVMVEGDDRATIERIAKVLAQKIEAAASSFGKI